MNLIDYFANVMTDYRTAQGVDGDGTGENAGSAGREGSGGDREQSKNVEASVKNVAGA